MKKDIYIFTNFPQKMNIINILLIYIRLISSKTNYLYKFFSFLVTNILLSWIFLKTFP